VYDLTTQGHGKMYHYVLDLLCTCCDGVVQESNPFKG